MAAFKALITPCRIMDEFIIPQHNAEPLLLDWDAFKSLATTAGARREVTKLKLLKAGSYVGITRVGGTDTEAVRLSNMVLIPSEGSNSVQALMRRDPTWRSRLVCIYRVDAIDWGNEYTDMSFDAQRLGMASQQRVLKIQAQRISESLR